MRTVKLVGFWLVTAIVLTFVMVNVHEIGHTIFARAFGDSNAFYTLHSNHLEGPGGGSCWGCNDFDATKLSFWGQFWTSAGGVVATQIVAWYLLVLLWRVPYGRFGKVLSLGVAIFLSDVLFQAFQVGNAKIATQTYLKRVDFTDMIWLLHRHWGTSVTLLKVSLGIVAFLYVVCVLLVLSRIVLQAQGGGAKPTKHGRQTRVLV